jgi:hypothetical protein
MVNYEKNCNLALHGPTILKTIALNPRKYISMQPGLYRALCVLRSHGKQLFIITNAHLSYVELVMTSTIGPNWKGLFDVCLADAQKPLFYNGQSPFHVIDLHNSDLKGSKFTSIAHLAGYLSQDEADSDSDAGPDEPVPEH